nr:hypothetical protein CcurKRNrm2_p071 [Cryptomonas curvata]
MNSIKHYISIIDLQIQKTGKLTILKWMAYFSEIVVSSQIFGEIYDKIRFRIGKKTYCFAYGNANKCNFGAQMSFLALLVSMYSLTLSIFLKYSNLPPIMKWDELELCAFRLGLWVITGYKLDSWFKSKFIKKYKMSQNRPKDKMEKIQRMEKLIGPSVRKVSKMFLYTIISLIISIIILCKEKWESYKEKKNKKK